MGARETEHLDGAVELNDMTDNYRRCATKAMKKPAYRNWRSEQREALTLRPHHLWMTGSGSGWLGLLTEVPHVVRSTRKREIGAELGEITVIMLLGAITWKGLLIVCFWGLGHFSAMLMWFHPQNVPSLKNSRESPFYTWISKQALQMSTGLKGRKAEKEVELQEVGVGLNMENPPPRQHFHPILTNKVPHWADFAPGELRIF